MARTLCVALCSILALTGVSLADDTENETPQQTRPLEPTESDLESFRLPSPEGDFIIDDGRSVFFRASGVGMFAASAADIATTEWGLSQGLHEANPAASQRGLRVATHIVGPAVVYWASERLIRDGKPKLALGLRVTLMVAYSYAAIHNARLIQGSPGFP